MTTFFKAFGITVGLILVSIASLTAAFAVGGLLWLLRMVQRNS